MKYNRNLKKGDIPFWLITLILALMGMVILIFIIMKAGGASFDNLDFIKGLF